MKTIFHIYPIKKNFLWTVLSFADEFNLRIISRIHDEFIYFVKLLKIEEEKNQTQIFSILTFTLEKRLYAFVIPKYFIQHVSFNPISCLLVQRFDGGLFMYDIYLFRYLWSRKQERSESKAIHL